MPRCHALSPAILSALLLLTAAHAQSFAPFAPDADDRTFLQSLTSTPPSQLPTVPVRLPPGHTLGMISSIASDPHTGLLWLLQRGDNYQPIVAVAPDGKVRHAFGSGAFLIPHALRLDPEGHLWTVDAGNSRIQEWTQTGTKLRTFNLPRNAATQSTPFTGATDIAFSPAGTLLVSDGYTNARILEYTREGQLLRSWGKPGTGPGAFNLPHALIVSPQKILYVADRENGRIQKFTLHGEYLGQIAHLGRVYDLALAPHNSLWVSLQPKAGPPGSAGWLVHLDAGTGRVLDSVRIAAGGGLHTLAVDPQGRLLTSLNNTVIRLQAPADSSQPAR